MTTATREAGGSQRKDGFDEISILWISEGMSCDGDSVSMTASDQPSIEDVALGLVPGLPKVNLYNKVLSPTLGGEEFLKPFREAARGELKPFILVIEGSIPNQNIIEGDGYWTSFGNDLDTGEPLTLNWWLDHLAPHAWAVVAAGTCATFGGIHAMAGNPTGSMGLADYLGWTTSPRAGCRSSTSLAARSSRRTSWRRSPGCSTTRRERHRRLRWTRTSVHSGCSARPCTRGAAVVPTTSRVTTRWTTTPPSAR
jgi:hypothetical protein